MLGCHLYRNLVRSIICETLAVVVHSIKKYSLYSSADIARLVLFVLQDGDVVERCLTAVNALASYHFKERIGGRGGLSSQLMESEGSNGKLQESISSHFLRLLLQLLLFEDFR
jgi:hypothetical protein